MSDIAKIIDKLRAHDLRLATAESCTGGLIAAAITDISGSSDVFDCGIVCYSNEIKKNLLNVDIDILINHGAVSQEAAIALANGVRKLALVDIAISTTGIAGPTGATADKPIGLVYIGLEDKDNCFVEKYIFQGDRQAVRNQSVECAIVMLEKLLENY